MMMSPVEQAVGHAAYLRLQLAGYLVFASAWCLIAAGVMRFLVDIFEHIHKSDDARRRPSLEVARGSKADRPSPVSVIPPVVSPVPALSARVLVFAPRKTRNRVVVR